MRAPTRTRWPRSRPSSATRWSCCPGRLADVGEDADTPKARPAEGGGRGARRRNAAAVADDTVWRSMRSAVRRECTRALRRRWGGDVRRQPEQDVARARGSFPRQSGGRVRPVALVRGRTAESSSCAASAGAPSPRRNEGGVGYDPLFIRTKGTGARSPRWARTPEERVVPPRRAFSRVLARLSADFEALLRVLGGEGEVGRDSRPLMARRRRRTPGTGRRRTLAVGDTRRWRRIDAER